jgi:hypothetical protein
MIKNKIIPPKSGMTVLLFGFFMEGVRPASRTMLFHFQTPFQSLFIFLRKIIDLLALSAF